MASEIQFFWDQIHENNFVIRSFFILKSVNNINGDFLTTAEKDTRIPGIWMQMLDAGLWTLDPGY